MIFLYNFHAWGAKLPEGCSVGFIRLNVISLSVTHRTFNGDIWSTSKAWLLLVLYREAVSGLKQRFHKSFHQSHRMYLTRLSKYVYYLIIYWLMNYLIKLRNLNGIKQLKMWNFTHVGWALRRSDGYTGALQLDVCSYLNKTKHLWEDMVSYSASVNT